MKIWINDIKLPEKDKFSEFFNYCSDLWAKAWDETLSEEERNEYMEQYHRAKYCLEQGIY